MILESVQTKSWKNHENEKQFAWNAENFAIFKENDKRKQAGAELGQAQHSWGWAWLI